MPAPDLGTAAVSAQCRPVRLQGTGLAATLLLVAPPSLPPHQDLEVGRTTARVWGGPTQTLQATQAVLETYGWVEATGPLVWSLPGTGSPACGGSPSVVRSRLVGQDQDWSGGDDDLALSAALAAAEEDLTGHAFQPWLWRWLDVDLGICDTDDNAHRVPVVWALRTALTDSDTEPAAVRQPALAAALRHSTRTSAGGVQRWRLLRHPPSGR